MRNRRDFLKAAGFGVAATASEAAEYTLPAWEPGVLEIHHISTGRGNCAFLLCPDGTTMMVDAGAYVVPPDRMFYVVDPKPDGTRRPGEWIARYVRRRIEKIRPVEIDLFIATHLHADHIGETGPETPQSRFADYRLAGIADVAETVPVKRILDRGYPDYAYPSPLTDAVQRNYRAFINSWITRGGKAEQVNPGSGEQIRLERDAKAYPEFAVRNLAANGQVWTGPGSNARQLFPGLASLKTVDYPSENICSCAFLFRYGKFRYFTAGDMTSCTNYGREPWRDVETPTALLAGPVDVAVANHHGYIDATGPEFVRALRPRVFVVPVWNAAHPTMPALYNMLSRELYPEDRDVFTTAVKAESQVAVRRLAEVKSSEGHVVVRVENGGDRYSIWVVTDQDESGRVTGKFGPHLAG